MTNSALFGFQFLDAQHSQPEVVINELVVYLEVLAGGVISIGTNAPPGSPSEGDAYIIGTSPTGAWAGRANAVAYYTASGWRFVPNVNSAGSPIALSTQHEGFGPFIDQTDGLPYYWDGAAWSLMTDGSGV